MKPPIYARPLSDEERLHLEEGLRSGNKPFLRRCQILLSSSAGQSVKVIASVLGCSGQTVRNVIRLFNSQGLGGVPLGSTRRKVSQRAFSDEAAETLKALLHQSPREFNYATSLWTLELVAQVSLAQGLTHELVSDETIRQTLLRLGIRWRRAKHWIVSPDPEYELKKNAEIA